MGRGDYLIGTDRRYFYTVGIRELIMSTYHRMILDKLKGHGVRRKQQVLQGAVHMTHCVTKGGSNAGGYAYFSDLKK